MIFVCLYVYMYVYFFFRDHSGGNGQMKRMYPDIKIYGGSLDRVPDVTK